ncbi:hypothetical protein C5167_020915 [Papaver somniferum]|uniref:Uncharacterized protein n=1 Tax=Papaver somniferum TaxID=3469 RepID=A0A4Y7IYI7_PAPSO|nr:hypothetical protein C5167_020915 [Papaver somniferum]
MVKLTLVKSVFASIPIYLLPLFVAPLDVITKLQRFPKTSYGIPMKPRKTSSCGMERALYCSGKGGIGIKSLRSINKAVITNGGRYSGERLILARQPVRKPSILEDFWCTTSTFEMDNGTALQSQRSISYDPLSGTGSSRNPTKFVNQGKAFLSGSKLVAGGFMGSLTWVKTESPNTALYYHLVCSLRTVNVVFGQHIGWNATYGGLLGTNKPFALPALSLQDMVYFLVWYLEQEGL